MRNERTKRRLSLGSAGCDAALPFSAHVRQNQIPTASRRWLETPEQSRVRDRAHAVADKCPGKAGEGENLLSLFRCRAVLVGAQRGLIDFAEPSCIGGIMVVAVQFRLPATDRAGVRWRSRREQCGDDSRAIGRLEPLRARRGGEWAQPDTAINRPNPPLDFLFFLSGPGRLRFDLATRKRRRWRGLHQSLPVRPRALRARRSKCQKSSGARRLLSQ